MYNIIYLQLNLFIYLKVKPNAEVGVTFSLHHNTKG